MKSSENYPRDFQEFLAQFPDERSCWHYLIGIRWPVGYICSACKSEKYWLTSKHKIHCSDCEKEFSITSGTIFQDSKKPLLLWFHIMWWVVAQKTGASPNNLMVSEPVELKILWDLVPMRPLGTGYINCVEQW
jgi:hypothetical protein